MRIHICVTKDEFLESGVSGGLGDWSRGVGVGVGEGGVGGLGSGVVGIGGLGSGSCSWFEITVKVL